MTGLEMIAARTSVRDFEDKEVPPELVEKLLHAAMAAPSARNVQPWHFMIVTRKSVLEDLADSLPNAPMLARAPMAILVAADMFEAEAGTPGLDFWIQDCSAAAQNLLLAAGELGLGGVWLGVHPARERIEQVKKLLKLPDNVSPLCLVAVGFPAKKGQPKDKYRADRVHWEQW